MRFKDKLIENLVFGRFGLNSKVFEKNFISFLCIVFIKHCALRSFCIKMICFSKIWFFQIFDRSNLLLNWSKLQLKIWFESAWLNCCLIDAGSIECDFRSIKPIFRPIKNHSQSFLKNISFSCVLQYFKTFQKAFWFSLFDWSNSSKFLSFSLNFFSGFLSSSTSKTFLPFPF